jgi:hypothetical protein
LLTLRRHRRRIEAGPQHGFTPQAKGIVDDSRLAQPIKFTCGGFIKTFNWQDTCTLLYYIEPQFAKESFLHDTSYE